MALKAVGSRGDWFATIEGKRVACAWSWWLTGNHYRDPVIDAFNVTNVVVTSNTLEFDLIQPRIASLE